MGTIEETTLSNALHLICQAISIVGWWVLTMKTWQKREYLKWHWMIYRLCAVSIFTAFVLLSEIMENTFDMSWNLWYWYPINWALVINEMALLYRVEDLIDENNNLKNKLKNDKN